MKNKRNGIKKWFYGKNTHNEIYREQYLGGILIGVFQNIH